MLYSALFASKFRSIGAVNAAEKEKLNATMYGQLVNSLLLRGVHSMSFVCIKHVLTLTFPIYIRSKAHSPFTPSESGSESDAL